MNVNKVLTKEYEKKLNWSLYENEPKTNPIQTQFKPKQTQLYNPPARIAEITCLRRLKSMVHSGIMLLVNRVRVPLTEVSNLKRQIGEI